MKASVVKWIVVCIAILNAAGAVAQPGAARAANVEEAQRGTLAMQSQDRRGPDNRDRAARGLRIFGIMRGKDHESIGPNRHGVWPIQPKRYLINPDEGPVTVLNPASKCVDGEVRIELDGTATAGKDGTILVTGMAKLFEGTACDTNDLEDDEEFSYSVAPGATVCKKIELKNSGTGGGDTASFKLIMQNLDRAGVIGSFRERVLSKKDVDARFERCSG